VNFFVLFAFIVSFELDPQSSFLRSHELKFLFFRQGFFAIFRIISNPFGTHSSPVSETNFQ